MASLGVAFSNSFMKKLCEALKIDPKRRIVGIDVCARVDNVTLVAVHELLDAGAAGEIVDLIEAEPDAVRVVFRDASQQPGM